MAEYSAIRIKEKDKILINLEVSPLKTATKVKEEALLFLTKKRSIENLECVCVQKSGKTLLIKAADFCNATPKYAIKELEENNIEKQWQRAQEKYTRTNYINKCSSLKLFDGIIDESITSSDLKLLYETNNKRSWEGVYYNAISRKEDKRFTKENRESFIKICREVLLKAPNFLYDVPGQNANTYSTPNLNAIISISYVYSDRRKELEDWNPSRNNPTRLLWNLLKHLFCKYEVPKFLMNGFVNGNFEAVYLFIHIGGGGSIKNFPFLPRLVLNKKVYHHLFSVPEDSSFIAGFRWAQIMSMGGSEYLYKQLMQKDVFEKDASDDFWVTVIDLFIKAVMFDYNKVPDIIDFIKHKRLNQKPNAPYVMKGRDIGQLLRHSEHWHREMSLVRRAEQRNRQVRGYSYQPPVLIPNWVGINVRDFHKSITKKKEDVIWNFSIVQIKSHQKLIDEGREMRHCVGSYAQSCSNGTCAIFSLSESHNGKLCTIEVRDMEIRQVRGKNNRSANENELKIIKEWASNAGIGFSKYS